MSLINLFVAARNAFSDWRNRQRAYGELMALDDRSLADIGIHRSQIAGIVEGFQGTAGKRPDPKLAPHPAVINARQARLAGAHRWFPPF
jgi:uncharacterized protein YjiS (DUF1127 family)